MGRKKTWSKNPKVTKARTKAAKLRAGNRKCFRCKVVFYKNRNEIRTLCDRCQLHCARCDEPLTVETLPKVQIKQAHQCANCQNETANIAKYRIKDKWRDAYLVKTYGITSVEYDAILKAQNGGCWVCGKVPSKGHNKLAVDHLHSKGEKKRNPREKRGRVRGLLCWQCNSAIGKFGDDIHKLKRAALYLEVWPAQKVLKKEKPNG